MAPRQPPAAIVAAARAAFRRYPKGAPVCVLLAQWAEESGWGEHTPPGSNNPFGEKALPRQAHVEAATTEILRGHVVPIDAPFRAFPSIEEAFAFHAEHLATSRWFIPARACLPDVRAFCLALGGGTAERPNYSTSPGYGEALWAVIEGSNLTQYDIQPGDAPMVQAIQSPVAAGGGQIQAATLDMARSVLMAVGTPVIAHGLATGDQWQAIAGGLVALGSAVWSYVAAHPGKTPPLQAIRSLVKGAGQGAAWNADVAALEQLLLPIAEKAVDAQIKARAGLLAGPADAIANRALESGATQAEQHLQV